VNTFGAKSPPCAAIVAETAIHPMQDVLVQDGLSRVNLPGVGEEYRAWQFGWDQVEPGHAQRLVRLDGLYEK
jgi:4-alpha-glucanotransferase